MSDSLKIILGGLVVTGDPAYRMGPLAILVRNDRIAEVSGRGEALRMMYPQAEVIDAKGKAVLPGFVDAHYHGESILLRYATAAVPLSRWDRELVVRNALGRVYGSMSSEDLRRLYEIANFASLKAGITTTAEFGFDRRDLPLNACIDALRRTDLRCMLGIHNAEQLEIAKRTQHPSIRFALTLPEENALTTYSLQTTLRLAKEHRWPIVFSCGESRRAFESLKKKFSRSVVQLADEYRLFDHALQLHHLAHYEAGDLELLAKAKIPLILSPTSILAKGADLPPLGDIFRMQIPVAFGTDWGLPDPFGNARALMGILSAQGLPDLPPRALFGMMTFQPARALGLENEVGSIEAGKQADLCFLAVNDLRLGLLANDRDPEAVLREIIGHASADRVTDVMVNGEFAVRSGHLLTCGEEELVLTGEQILRSLVDLPGPQAGAGAVIPLSASADVPPVIDLPGEEGFRVVRTGTSEDPSLARVLPMPPPRTNGPELPKDVRRMFGDDDSD